MTEVSTSPFFSELLDLLRKGSDENGQVIEAMPLTEIIDNYQHLFSGRGLIHLEKVLMEAFPIKDFVELGLARYYPRMYRGLPRLYHKDSPSQSVIKRNFTHLPSLKSQAVSRALFSLYSKLPAKGKISIFSWVMNDGLGDFMAAADAVRIFKSRFPELEVQWVAHKEEDPTGLLTPEILTLLRSSDLIIQMPTYYPFTQELLAALEKIESENPMPKMELIGEYGFVESSWFHPKSGRYSMGLHFLEKGILIRKLKQASWSQVKNEQLLQWRNTDNHFYLAYLTTPMGGAIYLHALLKSLENDEKSIDLCTPDLSWFIQYIERRKNVFEWDMGIESIEVSFQDQVHIIPISPKGKRLRILCPGPLEQADFQALLTLSGDFVAVRGNQSLTEAISIGKPFFYDGRDHARYFIKDLVALAENRIASHPATLTCIRGMGQAFLYNLPPQETEWVDETFFREKEEWTSIALSIGFALQDPDLVAGFQKLGQIAAAEYSANTFLCHLVQRALCHRQNPEIKRVEEEEVAKFAAGQQTFRELIHNMTRAIKEEK